MTNPKWQFAPRFRRNAFGWKSDAPIQRIKEALSEIRQVARKEPVLAAEGAILLLEKLSPALSNVDSSSGAIGTAVNRAIETLVPLIAKPAVDPRTRQRWLMRLREAINDDGMSYIELLGDYWGELCATPETASAWADEFLPVVRRTWSPEEPGHGFFNGTAACLSALCTAARHEELLALLERARFKWWGYRRWGVKALVAMGKKSEALRYAEESRGLNEPGWQIAEACEGILLSSGLCDEAYRRYAIEANRGTTHLATFRAIAKKYPEKPAADILHDLVASEPGNEGKWFAAAKDAGLFDIAIELVNRSHTDPRTLVRAARDYAAEQPDFALAAGMAALRWIAEGYGYEITGTEVLEAHRAVMQAASNAGIPANQVRDAIGKLIEGQQPHQQFIKKVLEHRLSD